MNESVRKAETSEIPVAKIVGLNQSGSTPSLELRVSIEGQDHDVGLPIGALASFGATDREAVEQILTAIGESSVLPAEVAVAVVEQMKKVFELPPKTGRDDVGHVATCLLK